MATGTYPIYRLINDDRSSSSSGEALQVRCCLTQSKGSNDEGKERLHGGEEMRVSDKGRSEVFGGSQQARGSDLTYCQKVS